MYEFSHDHYKRTARQKTDLFCTKSAFFRGLFLCTACGSDRERARMVRRAEFPPVKERKIIPGKLERTRFHPVFGLCCSDRMRVNENDHVFARETAKTSKMHIFDAEI